MRRRAPILALVLGGTLAGCGDAGARPLPRDAARLALGGRLYAQHGAVCHSADLEGQPDWRRRMPRRPPAGYQSDMPAFADTLSDDQIRAVLAFTESRWPEQVLEARAEMLRNSRRR